MTGFFPSVPTQIQFDLLYAPVGGQWRLFGIGVSLGQSGPAAPPGPAESEAQRKLQEELQKKAEEARKKAKPPAHQPPAPKPQ
jgi:hypothetical protein